MARPGGADLGASHAGDLIGANGYGHNGFTGMSQWITPDTCRYSVQLTNQVHPNRDNTSIARTRDTDLGQQWPSRE